MNNLDRIIELTDGKWPEDQAVGIEVLFDSDYKTIKTWLSGCDERFTKQQYDTRLKEITGRPDVKDWPEWANYCSQSPSGEWYALKREKEHVEFKDWRRLGNWLKIKRFNNGNTITKESWKNSLISREDAEMVDKENKKWIPEMGTECEYRIGGTWYGECEFIGERANGSVVIIADGEYKSYHEWQITFRPIENKEDKAINQITQLVAECPSTLAGCTAIAKAIYSKVKSGEIKID